MYYYGLFRMTLSEYDFIHAWDTVDLKHHSLLQSHEILDHIHSVGQQNRMYGELGYDHPMPRTDRAFYKDSSNLEDAGRTHQCIKNGLTPID